MNPDDINNYRKLDNGIIKQITIGELCNYNKEYSSKYNNYGIKGQCLAHLRLGFLLGNLNKVPSSILDVGYGNGDFLKASSNIITKCYGTDISQYTLPENIEFVDWKHVFDKHFDVITFFDSLEHFEDIDFVKNLDCNYILITLPWCHYDSDEWFLNWKHRRPNEHIWHFNKDSLCKFFTDMGYEHISIGVPFEDTIRKDDRYNPNILTGIFKKIKK